MTLSGKKKRKILKQIKHMQKEKSKMEGKQILSNQSEAGVFWSCDNSLTSKLSHCWFGSEPGFSKFVNGHCFVITVPCFKK